VIVRRTKKNRKVTDPPSNEEMVDENDLADAIESTGNNSNTNPPVIQNKSGYQRPPYKTPWETINELANFVEGEEQKEPAPPAKKLYATSSFLILFL
jgi:hypothetical protein